MLQYQKTFFPNEKLGVMLAIYMLEKDVKELLSKWNGSKEHSVIKMISQYEEDSFETDETFIGYDLICIDFEGEYYSIHCFMETIEVIEHFNMTFNNYGLLTTDDKREEYLEYLNNPNGMFNAYLWFMVKVKEIDLT